jgi:uncharacterized membrane protein
MSMSRDGRSVYRRQYTAVDYALAALFILVVAFVFLSVTEVAFSKTGFSRFQFVVILAVALLGSYVDVPVWKKSGVRPTVVVREVRAFWVTYRVPEYALTQVTTTIAVNVGGALVPLVVTFILLSEHPSVWLGALAATSLTALAVHMVARYVEGVGIVTPTLLPPVAAVIFSLPFAGGYLPIVAYVSGTLGTLLGADLSNLGKVSEGGTHVASIGGAGKFDGIFLTGIAAVLIASLV